MSLIPYPYDASTQDIWLYEPHTVSWSTGTAGVFRPYAWNPLSPLYGYRHSLEGIIARYRTFSTAAVNYTGVTEYLPYNDINDPYNKPAYFNSYPSSGWLMNDVAIMVCGHCFGAAGLSRSLDSMEAYWGGAGSYGNAVQLFRWIRGNGTIVDVPNSQVLRVFSNDAGYNLQGRDVAWNELVSPTSVTPLRLVDNRGMHEGNSAWFIDGSDKIIPARQGLGWYSTPYQFTQTKRYDKPLSLPDLRLYLHDSGSYLIVSIKPPSDPVLGDGIAGIMGFHVLGANDFGWANPQTEGSDLLQGSQIRQYWTTYRGKTFPAIEKAYPTNAYVPCSAATAASMDAAATNLLGAIQ
jgi:hypothetical protein